jgi:hypothetical protein
VTAPASRCRRRSGRGARPPARGDPRPPVRAGADGRPGAGRGRRRGEPAADPDGRVRRAHRRRPDGRRRPALPDLRRAGDVLPVRGRRGRPAVPRRVRLQARPGRPAATPTRSASPCNRPTSCATCAKTCSTAGCTVPGRGPRPVRRAAAHRGRPAGRPGRLAGPADPVLGRAGPLLVHRRAAG